MLNVLCGETTYMLRIGDRANVLDQDFGSFSDQLVSSYWRNEHNLLLVLFHLHSYINRFELVGGLQNSLPCRSSHGIWILYRLILSNICSRLQTRLYLSALVLFRIFWSKNL